MRERRRKDPRPQRLLQAALVLALGLQASTSYAQSWSGSRNDPALWQIIAIDRTGEPGFPYGREDVAGDGLSTFSAAEAGSDLRTIYADVEPTRLWLRAYVAGSDAPSADVQAFFFIDSDARNSTGGPAQGAELSELLGDDPTSGGYERAVSVQGNGDLAGLFEWNAMMRKWIDVTSARVIDALADVGSAEDPLAIGSGARGHFQVQLTHAFSGLTQSCGGTIFVRLVSDGPGTRDYADDAPEKLACQAEADPYGDPVILRPDGCTSDADCPANGSCRSGVCLYTYECTGNADCPSGYACASNRCVRVVTGSCADNGDCEGLVCDGARCVACTETGARACTGSLTCAPNGACVDPDGLPTAGSGGSGALQPGKVRGGAFSCAALTTRAESTPWPLLGLALALLQLRHRARSRRVNAVRGPL